jgi:hypothetical protein
MRIVPKVLGINQFSFTVFSPDLQLIFQLMGKSSHHHHQFFVLQQSKPCCDDYRWRKILAYSFGFAMMISQKQISIF